MGEAFADAIAGGGAVQVHGMPPLAPTAKFLLHRDARANGPAPQLPSDEKSPSESELESNNSWLLFTAFLGGWVSL